VAGAKSREGLWIGASRVLGRGVVKGVEATESLVGGVE